MYVIDPQPIQFRDATPGWYALWVAVSPSLPGGWLHPSARADETLHAKLRVHTMVTRLPRRAEDVKFTLSRPELEYLWEGRGNRPPRLSDEKLMRANTTEVPLVFRRNGWVLDRVEVKPVGGVLGARVANPTPDVNIPVLDVKSEARALGRGATMTAGVGIYEWTYVGLEKQLKKVGQRDLRFEAQVPAEIADGSAAEFSVVRTIEREESR